MDNIKYKQIFSNLLFLSFENKDFEKTSLSAMLKTEQAPILPEQGDASRYETKNYFPLSYY